MQGVLKNINTTSQPRVKRPVRPGLSKSMSGSNSVKITGLISKVNSPNHVIHQLDLPKMNVATPASKQIEVDSDTVRLRQISEDTTAHSPSSPTQNIYQDQSSFDSSQNSPYNSDLMHRASGLFSLGSSDFVFEPPSRDCIPEQLIDSLIESDQNPECSNIPNLLSIQDIIEIFSAKSADNKLPQVVSQLLVLVDRLKFKQRTGILDLTSQQLGLESARVLAKIISNMKNEQRLTRLILSMNNLGDQGVSQICEAIQSQKHAQSLVHLDFSNNQLYLPGISSILDCLREQESIISLDISSYSGENRNRLSRQSCGKLAEYLKSTSVLQFLKASNCCIGKFGFIALEKGLSMNQSLISLDLSKNDLGSTCGPLLAKILSNQQGLIELNLSHNMIGDQSIIELASVLKPNTRMCILQNLDLSYNSLMSYGLNALFEAISRNAYLINLSVDGNNMSQSMPEFIQFFIENQNLISLSMKDCAMSENVIMSISVGLAQNNSLKKLALYKNPLKNSGALLLAGSLREDPTTLSNRCLKVLNVSRCGIEDEGGYALAQVLRTHPCLTEMDLSQNLLCDSSGMAFIESLRKNFKVRQLHLDRNLIRLDYLNEICIKLRINNEKHHKESETRLRQKVTQLRTTEITPEELEQRYLDSEASVQKHTNHIEVLSKRIHLTEEQQINNDSNSELGKLSNELKEIQLESQAITKENIQTEGKQEHELMFIAISIQQTKNNIHACHAAKIQHETEILAKKQQIASMHPTKNALRRRSVYPDLKRRASVSQDIILHGSPTKEIITISTKETELAQLIEQNAKAEKDFSFLSTNLLELKKQVSSLSNKLAKAMRKQSIASNQLQSNQNKKSSIK